MNKQTRPSNRSSKKRLFETKKTNSYAKGKTLTVKHADGTKTIVTPNMQYFDGDFKTLAISLARYKERVVWSVI